ncbi:serine/threonine-protein kinase TTK/MPS1, partial [Phenoliferia sp. Uapishka_3]
MAATVAGPSTPSSSTFGKLFSKLRTPNTPSDRDRDSISNKNYSTPTAKGSHSLRQQASINSSSSSLSQISASGSSTSLALGDSPNGSAWDIEMPKFETGDWLNAGAASKIGGSGGGSPYGQLGAGAGTAASSTSTFASSAVSLASSSGGPEYPADSTIQQQPAPASSSLSLKALTMGSLSRTRGKEAASESGGSGGSGMSSTVDSSGDRLRKPSFLSRSSTDNQTTAKPFSRSWTQKGKDLLNRSGGPVQSDVETINSRIDDFKSPTATQGYSSLSSRTSSDSITPAARLSTLRRPFPSASVSTNRPRRAQRVPLSEVLKNEDEAEAGDEGVGGESQSSSQTSPEAPADSPPRFQPRPPGSPGIHGRSYSEVAPASPKLVPHATERSAATLTFTSTSSSSQLFVRKPLRPRATDESLGSSGGDTSPTTAADGSRQPSSSASLAASRAALTSAALRQRMLRSNPSPPAPLPTSSTANSSTRAETMTPGTTGFHRPTSSVEIRGSLRAEQGLAAEKPPRQSLDDRRRGPSDGDMMQPYRIARSASADILDAGAANGNSPDVEEAPLRGSQSLQRKASATLMTLGRRSSVSTQSRAALGLRRTDSGGDSRPGSSTAMYVDPPPSSSRRVEQHPAPVQDENDYDPASIRRPASALSMSSTSSAVPFPRHQQPLQYQQPPAQQHERDRQVLGETYRATNAAPLRPPRERVLAPKSSAPEVEYLAPVRDRSPGVGDVTPSLTHKQGYSSYQQQQQQMQMQQQQMQMQQQHQQQHPQQQIQHQQQYQPQQQQYPPMVAPAPEGPLPPKPRKPVILVVNGQRYHRIGLLGKGGSSRVYRVLDEANNLLAIKRVEISRNDAETRASFINEINLLEKLRGNPQIIRLVDSEMNEEKSKHFLLMVMEVGETDLANLLQEKASKPVSMNFIRYIWEQMLEAVQVIHGENVVHTDLKPANFVLVKGRLKLIDFGISKAIANDTTNIGRDQQIGTANYMPPEALMDSGMGQDGRRLMKLGRAADVWALGCILYQMVYRCTPYAHIRDIGQKIMAIQNPRFQIAYPPISYPVDERGEERKDQGVAIGPDLIAGMQGCLVFDKAKRLTIPELLEGAFLRRSGGESPEDKGATVDEDELAIIVQRVAKIVAKKSVSPEDAAMVATVRLLYCWFQVLSLTITFFPQKLMLELRELRQANR